MEEIKVGEYIRTYNGEIGKIIRIKDDDEYSYNYYICDDDRATCLKSMIVKHSFNIIDLIEEGDYVNGNEVVAIDYTEDEKGNYINVLGIMEIDDDYAYPTELRNLNIKTIVTKEQIKQIEYRIGD